MGFQGHFHKNKIYIETEAEQFQSKPDNSYFKINATLHYYVGAEESSRLKGAMLSYLVDLVGRSAKDSLRIVEETEKIQLKVVLADVTKEGFRKFPKSEIFGVVDRTMKTSKETYRRLNQHRVDYTSF